MYNLIGSEFIQMMLTVNRDAEAVAGKSEIRMRCPYCGDSKKSNKSKHLYVSVPKNENQLSFYNCKLCNASGIVGDHFLTDIGCSDSNVLVEITRHNTEIMKMPKYRLLKDIDIYPLKYNVISDSQRSRAKLQYINNRIGASFTYEDLKQLKIILNLNDIIMVNNLELTRHPDTVEGLNSFFIGFISYDNCYCTMRKVSNAELHNSINKRYINYNLVKKDDRSKNHYVVPSSVDILNPEPIRIHIAEGAFDVLSIYYNLNNRNAYQNIYAACGGKSYIQTLEFILTELGVMNYEVHMYPDRDVDDRTVRGIISKIVELPMNMYIHRNSMDGEKDFGVPMNRIRDSVIDARALLH